MPEKIEVRRPAAYAADPHRTFPAAGLLRCPAGNILRCYPTRQPGKESCPPPRFPGLCPPDEFPDGAFTGCLVLPRKRQVLLRFIQPPVPEKLEAPGQPGKRYPHAAKGSAVLRRVCVEAAKPHPEMGHIAEACAGYPLSRRGKTDAAGRAFPQEKNDLLPEPFLAALAQQGEIVRKNQDAGLLFLLFPGGPAGLRPQSRVAAV